MYEAVFKVDTNNTIDYFQTLLKILWEYYLWDLSKESKMEMLDVKRIEKGKLERTLKQVMLMKVGKNLKNTSIVRIWELPRSLSLSLSLSVQKKYFIKEEYKPHPVTNLKKSHLIPP